MISAVIQKQTKPIFSNFMQHKDNKMFMFNSLLSQNAFFPVLTYF